MDTCGTDRLEAKDVESAIVSRIVTDFNLTPILAKAHYDQMAGYFSEYERVPTRSGEICYLAVAATEAPGKPLRTCAKVQVCLELTDPRDLTVLSYVHGRNSLNFHEKRGILPPQVRQKVWSQP